MPPHFYSPNPPNIKSLRHPSIVTLNSTISLIPTFDNVISYAADEVTLKIYLNMYLNMSMIYPSQTTIQTETDFTRRIEILSSIECLTNCDQVLVEFFAHISHCEQIVGTILFFYS